MNASQRENDLYIRHKDWIRDGEKTMITKSFEKDMGVERSYCNEDSPIDRSFANDEVEWGKR